MLVPVIPDAMTNEIVVIRIEAKHLDPVIQVLALHQIAHEVYEISSVWEPKK
jgi:hypothetical protein